MKNHLCLKFNFVIQASLFFLLLLGSHNALNAKSLPGVFGHDDRQKVPQDKEPWQAIGQVNISGYRNTKKCSGTLIAPNKVLTAAHCLLDSRTRKKTPASRVHFVAGVFRGRYLAHSKAKCLLIHPRYRTQKPFLFFKQDLALIILRKNLSVQPIPLTTYMSKPHKKELIHASYSGDRRFALTAHKNCQRLQDIQGAWFTDCDTHFGSSGGPILVSDPIHKDKKRYSLTAIMSGMRVKRASIVVPIQSWLPFIKTARCP